MHWESVGHFIADTLNGLFENIDWKLIKDTFVTGLKGIANAINQFIKDFHWDNLSNTIANAINIIAEAVYTFFSTVNWDELGKNLGEQLRKAIEKIDWEMVGRALGSIIQAAIDFLRNLLSELSFEDITSAIGDLFKGIFEEANWEDVAKVALSLLAGALIMQSPALKLSAIALAVLTTFQDELLALDWGKAGETVGKGFIKFFDFITTAIENVDWWAVGESVRNFLVGIDWAGVAGSFFEAVGAAFGGLAAFLGGVLANAVDYFRDKTEECGGNVVLGILKGIGDALYDIGVWIKEHIFQPFIDGFKKTLEIHSPSKVMESMGGYIVQGLLNGLKESWKDVVSWITDKIQWLADKISGMAGSVKSAFSGGGTFSKAVSRIPKMSTSVTYAAYPAVSGPQSVAFPTYANLEFPAYANGQVIPRTMDPHLAWLGDNNRETEVVSPLSTIEGALENVINRSGKTQRNSGQSNEGWGSGDIVINIDGNEVFRITQEKAREYTKRTGNLAFT